MTEVVGNSLSSPTASLTAALSSSASSMTVSGWASPLPQTGTFRVRIDNELITVGSVSGSTLGGLGRGAESSSAATHLSGAGVELVLTAGALTAFVDQRQAAFVDPSGATASAIATALINAGLMASS